jgi:hypothetical protein
MEQLIEIAGRHAARLEEDIKLSRTRDEHIRVTARANEALELLNGLVAASAANHQLITNNDVSHHS